MKALATILFVLVIMAVLPAAYAQAPEAKYYGVAYWNGEWAPQGTVIAVYNSRGQRVGSFTKSDGVYYGNLAVPAEGYDVPGAYEDERLEFRENDQAIVTIPEEIHWKSGEAQRVDIFGGAQRTSCGTGSCLRTWTIWARSHPVTQYPVDGLGEEAYQGDAVYNTVRVENDTSPLVPIYGVVFTTITSPIGIRIIDDRPPETRAYSTWFALPPRKGFYAVPAGWQFIIDGPGPGVISFTYRIYIYQPDGGKSLVQEITQHTKVLGIARLYLPIISSGR